MKLESVEFTSKEKLFLESHKLKTWNKIPFLFCRRSASKPSHMSQLSITSGLSKCANFTSKLVKQSVYVASGSLFYSSFVRIQINAAETVIYTAWDTPCDIAFLWHRIAHCSTSSADAWSKQNAKLLWLMRFFIAFKISNLLYHIPKIVVEQNTISAIPKNRKNNEILRCCGHRIQWNQTLCRPKQLNYFQGIACFHCTGSPKYGEVRIRCNQICHKSASQAIP